MFDELFSNIGNKLKLLARIELIITLVTCALGFIGALIETSLLIFIAVIEVGIMGIITAICIFAFGQVVDDLHQLKENNVKKPADEFELPEL